MLGQRGRTPSACVPSGFSHTASSAGDQRQSKAGDAEQHAEAAVAGALVARAPIPQAAQTFARVAGAESGAERRGHPGAVVAAAAEAAVPVELGARRRHRWCWRSRRSSVAPGAALAVGGRLRR